MIRNKREVTMSNNNNTNIMEQAAELLDVAHKHQEHWTNTTAGEILDIQIAQVIKDIDENDLEHLYYSVRVLKGSVEESSKVLAEQSKEYFNAHDAI
jgi:hypothetical protein